DEYDGVRIRRFIAEADVWKSELIGERLRNLLLGCEVQAYEDGADPFAGFLVLSEGDLEILLRDQPRLNETLADLLAHSFLGLSRLLVGKSAEHRRRRHRAGAASPHRQALGSGGTTF